MRLTTSIETDITPVAVTGEELTALWWRGKQWAVTEYGIEALDGKYPIAKERLKEDFGTWSWIRQLSEKTWVDIADFTTAFCVAIVLHGYETRASIQM